MRGAKLFGIVVPGIRQRNRVTKFGQRPGGSAGSDSLSTWISPRKRCPGDAPERKCSAQATENSFFGSLTRFPSRAKKPCKSRIRRQFSEPQSKAKSQMRFPCPQGGGSRPSLLLQFPYAIAMPAHPGFTG